VPCPGLLPPVAGSNKIPGKRDAHGLQRPAVAGKPAGRGGEVVDWTVDETDPPVSGLDERLGRHLTVASLEAHAAYLAALPDHPAPVDIIPTFTAMSGKAMGVEHAVLFRPRLQALPEFFTDAMQD
jgi:hypothetical protein